MRLVFSPNDTDRLEAAQQALLDGFVAWARRSGRPAERVCVEAALDYKGAADGLLGRWTSATLTHLCTDRLPAKITLDRADWPLVPETLHAWIDYLTESGFLDGRSDPPDRLHAAVRDASADFTSAMADPYRYDLAKFWMTTMRAHGVDLDDEAQRDTFFEDIHAGRLDVDTSIPEAITERHLAEAQEADDQPDVPSLPLIHLPEQATLSKTAAQTPAVIHLMDVLTWLGPGRPLDAAPASAGSVTDAGAPGMGTAPGQDGVDVAAGRGVARVRGDWMDARLWVAWARAARLARPLKGRLVPVQRAAADLRDPLALWDRAFAALGRLAPALRAAGDPPSPVTTDLDATALDLLIPLYTEGIALPRLALIEMIQDNAADTYLFGGEDEATRMRAQLDGEVRRLLDALEALDAVRMFAPDDPDLREQTAGLAADLGVAEDPTVVQLTDLGAHGVHHRARALGWPAPTVDDLAGETAEVLIATVADHPPETFEAALEAWAGTRTAEAAASELSALAARTDDPHHRSLAELARARLRA